MFNVCWEESQQVKDAKYSKGQAPQSMGLSKQEYWSGLSFPSLGDLPDPEIKPTSPAWQTDFFTDEPPGKPK